MAAVKTHVGMLFWLAVGTLLIVAAPPTRAASPPSVVAPDVPVPAYLNVTYNASTDGFPLSYEEWRPAGFNASDPHPLLVYLHGLEGAKGHPVSGGVRSDFLRMLSLRSIEGATARGVVENASLNGYVVIAPNSRTAGGYFVNSPCGGPQEQDVLDAIASIRSFANVSSVYLLGFSMGSIGAFSLAAHHPALFDGIAVVAPVIDMFEESAWAAHQAALGAGWAIGGTNAFAALTCGNATASVPLLNYLSVVRFAPENLSGVRVWIAAGGIDLLAPNNGSDWAYLQVNNSFVNSTCTVEATGLEPANCTTTFQALHQLLPRMFQFRYVYEALAPHNIAQLSPADMFAFFGRSAPGGYFEAPFPPTTITAAPTP